MSMYGEGARVLVVDDNALVRRIVAEHLRRAGYRVEEAVDGRDALARFDLEPAEVVITDVNMPELDGLSLLARLRGRELPPEVILLTASRAGDAEAAIQALRLGAHDYLSKDAAAGDAVALAVRRALEKWRLRAENARLLSELQRLSLEDGLTGLGNRRAFDAALEQEMARALRHGHLLSVALADLDHFKRVNDTLGHRAGDGVLSDFGRVLLSVARAGDRVFRYGGEEFALLLPDTDSAGGLTLARRLVAATTARPLGHGRLTAAISCSVGVATLRGDDGPASLIARADAALYASKHAGRNRASAADPASPVARASDRRLCSRPS